MGGNGIAGGGCSSPQPVVDTVCSQPFVLNTPGVPSYQVLFSEHLTR